RSGGARIGGDVPARRPHRGGVPADGGRPGHPLDRGREDLRALVGGIWPRGAVAVSSLRGLETPEGVPIQLELASVGDRLVAVMIDPMLMHVLGLVLFIIVMLTRRR